MSWLDCTKHLSIALKAVGLDGKERDTSLVAFADDVFRKMVWDVHDGEEGVRRVLDESDQAQDEAPKSGGWARNESKRELVLDLRRKDLARKMQDGQLRGRVAASARHLSNQYSWNGRNGSKLTLRLRAAQRAWARWRPLGRQREGGAFEQRPSWERSWAR